MGERNEPTDRSAGGRLRSCALLAGGLKPSPLAAEAGLSPLDLLLAPGLTLMQLWCDKLAQLAAAEGTTPLAVRIVWGGASPAPSPACAAREEGGALTLQLAQEPRSYRGPAGVARDVCLAEEGADDDLFLLADAARAVLGDLTPLLVEHRRRDADVSIAHEADGSPSGLYLASRRSLALAQQDGYQDLKEQWLPKVRRGGLRIEAIQLPAESATSPVRTRQQALAVAASLARERSVLGAVQREGGVERVGRSGLRLAPGVVRAGVTVLDPQAAVSDTAVVVDSIVMAGAVVEREAVVARSIICPGAAVEAGAKVVDAVIGCGGRAARDALHRERS